MDYKTQIKTFLSAQEELDGGKHLSFKQYNPITDLHSSMFESAPVF